MFKTVSIAALAALVATSALAGVPKAKLTGGQFVGATQYTGLVDPDGYCASLAGLAAGQNTSSVATVTGLGATWTSTIANTNPSPQAQYGVSWINCQFAALPLATAFTAVNVAPTGATPIYEFTSFPGTAGSQVTSCLASNGTPYTLSSGNGTLANGLAQTLEITILPANGTGKDSGFKLTSTNSALTIGTNTLCFLSTDAVYLNSSK